MERKTFTEAAKCLNVEGMLAKCALFSGLKPEEVRALMDCMNASVVKYQKGEYILRAGEDTGRAGVLLSGSVIIEQVDYWGNRDILQEVTPGELFAVNYAILDEQVVPSNIIALEDSCVLSVDGDRMVKVCDKVCDCHNKVKDNLSLMLSEHNRALTQKVRHLSKRTTRDKLISYLTAASIYAGKKEFDIHLDRQQLADYLAVDRSAMSAELSKMKNEGMIDYRKNHFMLFTDGDEA